MLKNVSRYAVLPLLCLSLACASANLNAYKTIGATITVVDTGMKVYGAQVAAGKISQPDQDKVHAAYDKYVAAMGAAHGLIVTSGLATATPPDLAASAAVLLGLLNSLGVMK